MQRIADFEVNVRIRLLFVNEKFPRDEMPQLWVDFSMKEVVIL